MHLLDMENEQIMALEHALSELQVRDETTQQKLDSLIDHINKVLTHQPNQPIPQPTITPMPIIPSIPREGSVRPALPSEFDGDRSRGMDFLYSCQTYIHLCPGSFSDDQTKIMWALSYMKSGRAAKWSAHVLRWIEKIPTPIDLLTWNLAVRNSSQNSVQPTLELLLSIVSNPY